MKLIEVKNFSDVDVSYPIDEAKLDNDGNVITKEGLIETTGKVLTWELKAGETAKFPEYVATILIDRFGQKDSKATQRFLEIVGEIEEVEEVRVEAGAILCKKCGKSFKSTKGLALHIAHNHEEMLL